MGKISTRELFDRYYEQSGLPKTRLANFKKEIDIPILFEYEKKIGKELVDMGKDEILYLMKVLLTKSLDEDNKETIIFSQYKVIRTLLISVCEWYSYNVEPITIWLRSPDLKGSKGLMKVLNISAIPITWDNIRDVCKQMRQNGDDDRADYTELVCGLFYCGFFETSEVINLKENNINFRTGIVALPGRSVKLNERTLILLKANHEATSFKTARIGCIMKNWRDSYMRFPVAPKLEYEFDKRDETLMSIAIHKILTEYVRNVYGLKLTYKNIFWLGFHDYIVSRCGQERTNEIIASMAIMEDIDELLQYAREFGVPDGINSAYMKTHLRLFVNQN